MGRRLRWTPRTQSVPRSCVTSTTVSTWSIWPRMRDSMSCWHSNTQWRYETVWMSLISTQNIFHQVFSLFAQKYFNYTCILSSILGEKIIILKNCWTHIYNFIREVDRHSLHQWMKALLNNFSKKLRVYIKIDYLSHSLIYLGKSHT